MTKNLKPISKFLSFVLRHRPEEIGLTLDTQGWADVDELIAKAPTKYKITRTALREVVATNDKQRFALSQNGNRIRANQGHSTNVDLALTSIEPPETLYHGTATQFLDSILVEGLKPGSRQHVHLSGDIKTASKVGQRHGKPVILTLPARLMHDAGHTFYRSENGVWLTDHIPAEALTVTGETE